VKRFEFSLARVLEWRRLQAEKEEILLERLRAARAGLAAEKQNLTRELESTIRRILCADNVASDDLCFLDEFRAYARQAMFQFERRIAAADADIHKQVAAVKEARRAYRLLEKLREKRWKEWEAEYDRELERQASESFLVKWNLEKQQASSIGER
jgi:hypothetical protein